MLFRSNEETGFKLALNAIEPNNLTDDKFDQLFATCLTSVSMKLGEIDMRTSKRIDKLCESIEFEHVERTLVHNDTEIVIQLDSLDKMDDKEFDSFGSKVIKMIDEKIKSNNELLKNGVNTKPLTPLEEALR